VIHVPGDFSTIQGALHAAAPGDEIEVAPGTYNEVIQFQGKAVTLRSAGGPAVTTIDGTGFNESVVRCISGEGSDTVLQGFTITGGSATLGGGMRNEGSSPTVIDCIFRGNSAADRGGGMHNLMAHPTVIDSEFSDNFGAEMGGGMYNELSSPTVSGCIFRENTANKGAGMRNYIDADPTITDSVFIHNSASEDGGGVGNRKNSKPTVTRCRFIGNTAVGSAGGIHNYVGNAIETGVPVVISSLFVGNSASEGGAMRNGDVGPIVTNCTFVGNSGSGMYNRNSSTPTVTNSLFWGNPGGSFTGGGLEIVTFSVVEGGHAGTGNIDAGPLFVDPVGPDGDPSTPEDGDYRLAVGSPGLDAGDNSAPNMPPTDLDGNPRILNGTVDMGAYELPGGCDDGVGCTDDDCDGPGGVPVHTPNDANCDNAQFCDGSETCDQLLDCQAGTPPPIDDGVTCTDDSCDEVNDVVVNAANDANCDDGNDCTADSCDEVSGCANVAIVPCEPQASPVPAVSPWGMFLLAIAIAIVGGVRAQRRVNRNR
jgi:hypothetical protein